MCSRQCQNVFCVFSLFCCDIFFSKRYRSNKDSPKITYFQLCSVFLWLASIFKGLGESPNACKTTLTTKSHLTQRPNDSPNWPFPCLLRMPTVASSSSSSSSSSSEESSSDESWERLNYYSYNYYCCYLTNHTWEWAAWWFFTYPDSVFQRYLQRKY